MEQSRLSNTLAEDHDKLILRRRVFDAMKQLEPPQRSVMTLSCVLSADPVDLRELNEASCHDESLSTKIVTLVNCPIFGLSFPVSTLEQAVMALGAEHLRVLILSASLLQRIAEDLPVAAQKIYWRRAFQVAGFSYHLASCSDRCEPSSAYLAGILHDVGLVPLLMIAENCDLSENRCMFEEDANSIRAQREEFGIDHLYLGRLIGMMWGFPAAFIEVFENHCLPGQNRTVSRFCNIVAAAASLARLGKTGGNMQ